jgi:integrase
MIRRTKDKELKRLRFHDLRHSHATQLFRQGIHPKIVSERLGHATVSITLDLYSHVLPGMQEDAANKADAALRAAMGKVG